MNQKKCSQKYFVAQCMLVLYIFVSFFSVHFHEHSAMENSHTHFSFIQDTDEHHDESHDTDEQDENTQDCLSCFYFQYQHGVEMAFFSFTWVQDWIFSQAIYSYFQKFGNIIHSSQLLRGPPVA